MTPADIRAFRQSLGLSAEAFARAVGVGGGRLIRRWEAGEHAPVGSVIRLIELSGAVPGVREWLISRGATKP